MVVNMTIQNADNALVSALKSVCKLYPEAKVSIKKQSSHADELKAEILEEFHNGTLNTFASMDEYDVAHGL
ncbi:hypothetical protein [Treponema brennaborense]|uniref:Uncharacterized protein n=1 Tax=Treponema brennaborense (strain DSM 12168 / CIP 105900 / DD5/3) TaxID=906968 RepID=F4LQ00_TREBD|nr:hypothetical protein [Treponema brennaborense]AEE17078.1 hypothetical protein Trebr_1656 [Treponema brennaborense DSM 12168]